MIRETDTVPLLDCAGRVLAEDVSAGFDNPPFDRSPVDGYAVRSADIAQASQENPAVLQVIGEVDAGGWSDDEVGPGQAMRIMTVLHQLRGRKRLALHQGHAAAPQAAGH